MWVFLAVTGHSLSLTHFSTAGRLIFLAGMVWFKTLIKRRHSNVLMVVRQDIFHSYLNAEIHSNAALNPANADDSFTPSRARGYISDQQHSNAPFPCL